MGRSSGGVYIERVILESKAFLSIKLPASFIVLFQFLLKRKMVKLKKKRGRDRWVIENNGEIVFTYGEAEKLGISRPRQELVEKEFIDVAHYGGGYNGNVSLFSISERWRGYGTDDFETVTMEKDMRISERMKKYHHVSKAETLQKTKSAENTSGRRVKRLKRKSK